MVGSSDSMIVPSASGGLVGSSQSLMGYLEGW